MAQKDKDNASVENNDAQSVSRKKRLGTGAILGISAGAVLLIAGTFSAGVAVGHVADTRGPDSGHSQSRDMAEAKPGMKDGHGKDKNHSHKGDESKPGKMESPRHSQMKGNSGGPMSENSSEDIEESVTPTP